MTPQSAGAKGGAQKEQRAINAELPPADPRPMGPRVDMDHEPRVAHTGEPAATAAEALQRTPHRVRIGNRTFRIYTSNETHRDMITSSLQRMPENHRRLLPDRIVTADRLTGGAESGGGHHSDRLEVSTASLERDERRSDGLSMTTLHEAGHSVDSGSALSRQERRRSHPPGGLARMHQPEQYRRQASIPQNQRERILARENGEQDLRRRQASENFADAYMYFMAGTPNQHPEDARMVSESLEALHQAQARGASQD